MALTPAHDMLSSLSILVLVLLRPQGPYGLLILWFSVLFSRGFGLPLMYQFYSLQSIIYYLLTSLAVLLDVCGLSAHIHCITLLYILYIALTFLFSLKKTQTKHFVIILYVKFNIRKCFTFLLN